MPSTDHLLLGGTGEEKEGGAGKADRGAVQSLVLQLQHMILTLREEHGVSCAVLGKDGRIVTFARTAEGGEDDGDGGGGGDDDNRNEAKEMEENKAAEDSPVVVGRTRKGRRLRSLGSLVGHELSDVILKVNHSGGAQDATYLYACSEGLRQHSDYFDALFKHDFVEARDRVVELNLPCVEMLEPTLFYLYTGQAPEPLPHGGAESLTPELLFGLLSNAKFLLMDGLVRHCGDFVTRLVQGGRLEAFICHPGFGPELFPARSLLRLLDGVGQDGTAPAEVRARLLGTAFAWLEGLDDDTLGLVVPGPDLAALSTKAGHIAAGLPFATLAALQEARPQGFRRLLSLASFVPALVAVEAAVAEQKQLLQVQRCRACRVLVAYALKGKRDCVKHYHNGTFIEGQPPFDGVWTCCHRPGMSAPGCDQSSTYHQLDPAAWFDYERAESL